MNFIAWLRSHRHWLSFTLTLLLLPLLQDLLANWIFGISDQRPGRTFILILFGLVTALFVWGVIYYLDRQPPAQVVARERQPKRYPGLIALVSKRGKSDRMLAHEVALRYHLLETSAGGQMVQRCWFVASGGADGSVAEAEEVRQRYQDRCNITIIEVNDAYDANEMINRINALYASLVAENEVAMANGSTQPLRADQIIADFTGGTSPMSVGLALACHQRSPLQYIYGGKVKEIASTPVLAPVNQ